MPRRLRAPKAKPGELVAKWGKVEGMEDVCYAWGDGVSKCDAHLLNSALSAKQHRPFDGSWSPSFLDELKSRGYDITTLKFSIRKL
jgi:hypothetical protein